MQTTDEKNEALRRETQAYLAKIRRTIQAGKEMVASVDLRLAETDRLLAQEGLTREQVANLTFTAEQKAAVEAELKRRGLPSLSEIESEEARPREIRGGGTPPAPDAVERDGTAENRRKKFGVMMQQFRM